ncbi:MAG: Chromate resistance protein ChrB [Thermoplasmata archaeon]
MTRGRISPGRSLILAYQLPENPSRFRVSVWRRLRNTGAQTIHRALFALPDTPLNRLRALDIAHDVEAWGGKAWIFLGTPLPRSNRNGPKRRVPTRRSAIRETGNAEE